MQRSKEFAKSVLARRKVRKLFLIFHIPAAWTLIRLNGLFDDNWYRLQYGGHRHERFKNKAPLLHYLYAGRKIGLTPSPFFVPEYYDHRRWNHSILDPLVKYCISRETWGAKTSVLFDGGRYKVSSRMRPPLATYMRGLRAGDEQLVYDIFQSNRSWNMVKDSVYARALERRHQYEAQKTSEPTIYFDEDLSKKKILEYAAYFDSSSKPLVSIVMPVWNRQELICPAIDSVLAQTYDNWELLVVDDGSTDATVDVVREYEEQDSRIKLFTPGHSGVCGARNHGIEKAAGEWVAFLDSDNTWTENYLNTTLASLLDRGEKVAYAAIKMNRKDTVLYRAAKPNPNLLETGNYVDLNALVVDHKLLESINSFDTALRRMVDYDLVIRLSKLTPFIYVPVVGVEYTDHEDASRITTTESLSWDGVVKSKNFIDWEKLSGKRQAKTLDIVLPVKDGAFSAAHSLSGILSSLEDTSARVVVSDAYSNSALNVTMAAVEALDERVSYFRFPAARDAVLASNYGFSETTSDKVVFVNQHVTVEPGWLKPLIDAVSENTIAGPLQLQASRLVRSAGVEFHGEYAIPVNVLEDHPLSDVSVLDGVIEADGLMNGCFAVKSKLYAELQGLNPLYDKGFELQDLSLRARARGVRSVVVKNSTVINPDSGRGWYSAGQKQYLSDWQDNVPSKQSDIWGLSGFRVDAYKQVHQEKGEQSMLRPSLSLLRKKRGSYRWAIKISSPADERRHIWGDTHYAEALAKSLTKLGQRAAIDYHGYHERPTSYLDDIVLDLRGLDDTQPQPGALNIMWVISHPEKLTPEIVNKFDVVFAAGKKWADYMSEKSGKQIEYLPQCTDPEVFHPTEPDPQFADKVLFVGNSRNVLRPIVRDAIAAGIDVNVYGGGWEGLIDSKYIKGTYIPNDRLTYAYSSAAVVLNDHWDDMREWGFISNRIFDAASAGSIVITDYVEGIESIRLNTVKCYRNTKELSNMISEISAKDTTINAVKSHAYIVRTHSFDSRASELLGRVEPIL